ncbi:isoleucine--tRNA ligase [Rhabdothermincola sediminis]|uniref:isoleucine--tRNA ligase n=1 Tax=Rhabdothermincola sediminis TaxID=2751370 RepID=UPI001AA0121D|nr:isoleucine--tRNA ligase [Rhabdothermincola sediminis]
MPFGPVDPDLDLVALEERVLARWAERDIVGAVRRLRKDGEPWIFYEGPPTANGRPGLHHVWARVFKDLYPRFQTMRGKRVPRKGGWDCHGLPVELEVEKELGLSSKQEIEAFGIANFNQRCRESVHRYVEHWGALTSRAGVWIDTADAYWTLSNEYIESVWWLLEQMWVKGLLYEGHRVIPYCARCGTALSSHELGQPDVYRDVVDPSVYVRFPLVDRDADLLVWTTTPWTLISNVAAAVGPDIDYVRVRDQGGGRDLVMAAARAPEDAEVLERWRGHDLVGWSYRRPFDLLEPPVGADGWRVVAADFVSTDEGTGIVHLAPAFGEDDARVGRAEDLPVLNPVQADGTFDQRTGPFAGRFVKDADPAIIEDLRARGLLVREQPYEHAYPHCWRCGTPLIYWAKTSWFIRTSEQRDTLIRENEKINWQPPNIKYGRFGKWLEGNVDWALSRDRFWGTPLPIWRCRSCGSDTCIGSVAELSRRAGRDLSELDLHRPYVDEVTFPCEHCGGDAHRLPPVLDAWFDSGAMPSSQFHYPFDNDETFHRSFPADFICEAIDQTRGWFYSLLAVNALVFGQTPYRNVVCLALVVDEHGQKMSKSRGNVIEPWDIFNTQGADALRWYFFSGGQPWTPRRVHEDGIRESTRQTLLTLWNVHSFFATYADLDGWQPDGQAPSTPTHVLDRWILSELDDTIEQVTAALEAFDALEGASRLARFVDDLSNWYVRRSRARFWKSSDPTAHATLYRCLTTTARLLAPFCPFLAEEIYTTLTGEDSVHLADWPQPGGHRDEALAAQMEGARRLVGIGRAARTDAKVKVRQPLRRAMILHPGAPLDPEVQQEVIAELNVKSLETIDTLSGLMSWSILPNFRVLGPRLGPKVNEIKRALTSADGSALRQQLVDQGFIEVAGERLVAGDVELRAQRHEAFALAEDAGWAVALDLELDPELRAEGTARELVRALNELRKESGFEIADRIRVRIEPAPAVAAALGEHRDWIAGEILATTFEVRDIGDGTGVQVIDVDGEPVRVSLERA